MNSSRKHSPEQMQCDLNSKPPPRSPYERWVWLSLFLINVATLALQIAQLSVPEWLEVGSGPTHISGGLLLCHSCPYDWSDSPYSDIIDSNCDDSPLMEYCDFFRHLRSSGGAFIFIECISGIFLLVWQVKLVFQILGRECLAHIPWLAYVHPVLATLLQVFSLALWSGMTKAKFTGSCDEYSGKDSDICTQAGPAIAIVTCITLALTTVVYTVALSRWEKLPKGGFEPADPGSLVLEERKGMPNQRV